MVLQVLLKPLLQGNVFDFDTGQHNSLRFKRSYPDPDTLGNCRSTTRKHLQACKQVTASRHNHLTT